jgi:uncharacterized protein (DUF1697 family)
MTRCVAFLRAINVSGHTVKMEQLRQIFEGLGLAEVETFIASGNVIFAANAEAPRALETRLESGLKATLGYAVATFIRTDAELAASANYQPFPPAQLAEAAALNIAFLAEPLDEASIQKLLALQTDIDTFHVHGREIYWLCRKKQSESTFSNAVLEKTLRCKATLRSISTLHKLVEKYAFTETV